MTEYDLVIVITLSLAALLIVIIVIFTYEMMSNQRTQGLRMVKS